MRILVQAIGIIGLFFCPSTGLSSGFIPSSTWPKTSGVQSAGSGNAPHRRRSVPKCRRRLMPRRIGLPAWPVAMMPRVLSCPCLPWWFDPCLAQHLPAESAGPIPCLVREAKLGVSCALREFEGVGRGAHADDRPARLDVIDDVLHLLVGQVAEARGDDHQVGVSRAFQPGNVVGRCRD